MEYMESFKNYEKSGVPKNAGTDSGDGFDLGRMRHLLQQLGNPQSKFKVAFLSSFDFDVVHLFLHFLCHEITNFNWVSPVFWDFINSI